MAIKYAPADDGVALYAARHPKGPGLKRGRPTKERAAQRDATIETVEIEIIKPTAGLTIEAKFDRNAYQREYMRKWRKAQKPNSPSSPQPTYRPQFQFGASAVCRTSRTGRGEMQSYRRGRADLAGFRRSRDGLSED